MKFAFYLFQGCIEAVARKPEWPSGFNTGFGLWCVNRNAQTRVSDLELPWFLRTHYPQGAWSTSRWRKRCTLRFCTDFTQNFKIADCRWRERPKRAQQPWPVCCPLMRWFGCWIQSLKRENIPWIKLPSKCWPKWRSIRIAKTLSYHIWQILCLVCLE